MKERLETFDIARALCIVLVVVGHYNPDNAPMWWKSVNQFIYSFHMPVFLFISGFIYAFSIKKGNYLTFIWKKVKRLLLPYLTASIIVVAIKLLTQGFAYVENPVGIDTFIKILYLPAAGYYLWFVWALFIMFAIIQLCPSRRAHTLLLLVSIILYFFPHTLPNAFCLKEFQKMWVFFMLGVVLFELKILPIFHTKWFWSVSLVLYIVAYSIFPADANWQQLIVAILGIGMTLSIASMLCAAPWLKEQIILPIAVSSYTIYLYHTTCSGFAKAALAKISLPDTLFVCGAILVVICGLIIPLCVHHLIKNTQMLKWTIGL